MPWKEHPFASVLLRSEKKVQKEGKKNNHRVCEKRFFTEVFKLAYGGGGACNIIMTFFNCSVSSKKVLLHFFNNSDVYQ